MNWIMITLFLNAQTGELDHFTQHPATIEECAQPAKPVPTRDGLAQMTICKQMDQHNKPVPAMPTGPKVEI